MKWVSFGFVLLALAACEHGKGGAMVDRDGGSGLVCGGFSGTQCPADEWCDFPRNDCGGADDTGTCRPRPVGCPDLAQPICACDGIVHGNECEAQAAGSDVSVAGNCPAAPGFFNCGSSVCDLSHQYCQRTGSDIGGEPDSFACLELPLTCGTAPTCGCLAEEPCGTQCSGDATAGLTAICFGG